MATTLTRYAGPVPIPDAPEPWQTQTDVFPFFYADGSTLVIELGGRSQAVFDTVQEAIAYARSLGWEFRQVTGPSFSGGADTRPERPTA